MADLSKLAQLMAQSDEPTRKAILQRIPQVIGRELETNELESLLGGMTLPEQEQFGLKTGGGTSGFMGETTPNEVRTGLMGLIPIGPAAQAIPRAIGMAGGEMAGEEIGGIAGAIGGMIAGGGLAGMGSKVVREALTEAGLMKPTKDQAGRLAKILMQNISKKTLPESTPGPLDVRTSDVFPQRLALPWSGIRMEPQRNVVPEGMSGAIHHVPIEGQATGGFKQTRVGELGNKALTVGTEGLDAKGKSIYTPLGEETFKGVNKPGTNLGPSFEFETDIIKKRNVEAELKDFQKKLKKMVEPILEKNKKQIKQKGLPKNIVKVSASSAEKKAIAYAKAKEEIEHGTGD